MVEKKKNNTDKRKIKYEGIGKKIWQVIDMIGVQQVLSMLYGSERLPSLWGHPNKLRTNHAFTVMRAQYLLCSDQ